VSDITDKIRTWMEESGRPLEMQVAAEFMQTPATVVQSTYYIDPDNQLSREIDVVATYTYRKTHSVSICIECKAKPPPFIVLLPSECDRKHDRCISRAARHDLDREFAWGSEEKLMRSSLYDPSVPVGHAVLTMSRAREDGRSEQPDKGWIAAMSAAKAAHSYAGRLQGSEAPWHIAFPVVVTDAVLATAQLRHGVLKIEEVDHAQFALRWPFDGTGTVLVDFVRVGALASFVLGCTAASGELAKHALTK
jgi:hypothetical protein